ncbi:MAG TPA: LemA family protein, partial [Candidatus Acetothermia bacterium]|nr:LemA family protein [Candidatus Acetothermia bacterium]
AIAVFPQSMIASMFHFKEREFYTLPGAEQREAPKVQF